MSADTNPSQDGQERPVIRTTVLEDAHTLAVNQEFSPEEAEVAEAISPGLGAVEEAMSNIKNTSGELGCIYFSGSIDNDGKIVIEMPQG